MVDTTVTTTTATTGATTGTGAANTQSTEKEEQNGFKNTLASAYHKATTTYDHLMEPIREINEYVDKKNELDAGFEHQGMTEDVYNEKVKELQTEYFGEDQSRLALANKFEAIQDWQDAHGITEIRESISGVTASIKEAFSKTSVGQKFEEIKLAAAEMGKEDQTEHKESEAASKESTDKEQDGFLNGDDLPDQMPANEREEVLEKRRAAARGNEAETYLETNGISDGISAETDGFER